MASGRGGAAPLRFPAVARLELDELLDQLVERAGEVRGTQGRLRGLLAATRHVTGGLELDELLQRLVDAARDLVGARFAALGVVREGRLVRFLHAGMDAEQVAAIGGLPEGKGVLGTLIERPEPLRMRDLTTHPEAVGFPAGHPPMRSFLGVPVMVAGRVYGNLYLCEAERGEFGADDEELAQALASAAGVAIENALLLERARHRERWRAASAELARDLLDRSGLDEALARLLRIVVQVAPARGAALTRVAADEPDRVRVEAAVGDVAAWEGEAVPAERSITLAALDAGTALTVVDAGADSRTSAIVDRVPSVRAVAAAPLDTDPAPGADRSVLVLTRSGADEPFDAEDTRMLEEFAAHAATAIALARSRRDRETLRRLEDREALAVEVQESIVRRVQRAALALTATASTADLDTRDRLLAQVADLDDVARSVRDAILPR